MKKVLKHYPVIASTLALVVALTGATAMATGVLVTSKQIRNGTILTQDIHKNGVRSSDIRTSAVTSSDLKTDAVKSEDIGTDQVQSSDIGEGQVQPQDVTMPDPVQLRELDTEVLQPPTMDFSLVSVIGSYTKEDPASVLEVTWTGSVEGRNEIETSGCVFQLRVDGQPSPGGAGEVFGQGLVSVSASALWSGLGAGAHKIEVWARGVLPESPTGIENGDRCVVGPTAAGTDQTFVVAEQVI